MLKVAMATFGPYAGTKFALEAVSDALRRELGPLGVRVVVVEPGGIRTEMGERGIATTRRLAEAMSAQQRDRYGPLVQAVMALTAAGTAGGRSAEDAARVIAKAVTAAKPRTRYTIGPDAALLTQLARILPDRMLDRVIAAGLRPYRCENRCRVKRQRARQWRHLVRAGGLAVRSQARRSPGAGLPWRRRPHHPGTQGMRPDV
ncbi:SDR family NAD(P)-dependent oxidoreductase [[Actinomadura] parvosata]|uniref:SDR family NAD(P)-dependent oxidoreductase n=1 Tax=[Actinomadura] parvosata TaxID=1955412 RepID=UPI001C90C30C|nr:SDR family NAD(P)-dependent oxidoreductase [Nonomuraea sp. ATCC 55076]